MLFVIIALVAFFGILSFFVLEVVESRQFMTVDSVPERDVAIVFGAGLLRTGEPTAVLRDRVETAVELYKTGKIRGILMTGDNSYIDYNEPAAMRQYALDLGVPDSAITLDYAGRRTYDSCYRAKVIFGVSEAILVTQRFHLVRAMFLCQNLGVDAIGVEANNRQYRRSSLIYWNIREILARNVAILDVILKPEPILGDPEPIKLEDVDGTQ